MSNEQMKNQLEDQHMDESQLNARRMKEDWQDDPGTENRVPLDVLQITACRGAFDRRGYLSWNHDV